MPGTLAPLHLPLSVIMPCRSCLQPVARDRHLAQR
jgi:hypothetical protein